MHTPPPQSALHSLARAYGIEESYVDNEGGRRDATPDALVAILSALGAPLSDASEAPKALATHRRQQWERPIDPIAVAWAGRGSVTLRLPATVTGSYALSLTSEDGQVSRVQGSLSGTDDSVVTSEDVEGTQYLARRIELPHPLPSGYYDGTLQCGGTTSHFRVLSAPERVWSPAQARPHWGVFVPLHALHSDTSRGAGSLADLSALMHVVGDRGGSVVGTLPLLAAYLDEPFEPSPYSPASRLAWNELYLDLETIPEFAASAKARAALASPQAVATTARLNNAELVDYREQFLLQRECLQAMAEHCWATGGARLAALVAFAEARPEIDMYAKFRAVGDRQRSTWQNWPSPLCDGTIHANDYAAADYRYHLFAQWCMHEQLTALSERAPKDGLGLYLDLPIGVGGSSFDTWRHRDVYAHGLSTGAPPDLLFAGGQNWAFPPLHPERVRDDGYRHLIAVVRNHLRYAGVLRIDHVMGLHRLYIIPQGCSAKEGVYIKYRSEELYALLCIESHRSQTLLAGEDLGTVPEVVRETMARTGVHGLHVLQYEARCDQPEPLPPPPAGSVATINTHDMPPFAAYWDGVDIDDRAALGWLTDAQRDAEHVQRAQVRGEIRRFLRRYQPLAPDATAAETLSAAITHLGSSPAAVALVSLEDLWGETAPQNVPGTWRECPNWQRRAKLSLEALVASKEIDALLSQLDHARTGAGHREVGPVRHDTTRLSDDDLYLLGEGTHERIYKVLGAHAESVEGTEGTTFAVWAPSATYVAVIGDFNGWDDGRHPLAARGNSGVWEGFIPGVRPGALYKFQVTGADGSAAHKADPVGQQHEGAPKTAAIVPRADYVWSDADWMASRAARNRHDAPISIYEVHLGSWMRVPGEGNRVLGYRELAPKLAAHVNKLGFTHVEILPIMEHPFFGSWGYQITGYFSATSRYGSPNDLRALIDHLHQEGIGVILDWVPSHFPSDAHALASFDGTHLYEHADPRQGFHPDWNSLIFNYGRNEVAAFLVSNALFWLDEFHADGLRVDGVASMLYRDYSRKEGEWIPNIHGGRENLEAIAVLRRVNEAVYRSFPDVQTYAEESTSWPMVSRPTHIGGLGFGFKWDMGWMHDMLGYLARDPIHRGFHQQELTFRMIYAWGESFVLSLSHDEVVHGKGSLLGKMPGDAWQQAANLRLLFAMQWMQPGKKLLFMGGEFGQRAEWDHDRSLDWHLLQDPLHAGIMQWVGDLNRVMLDNPALYELDHDPRGFVWIDFSDATHSVLSFARRGLSGSWILVVFNFTPIPRHDYSVGAPAGGTWREVLNSDAEAYAGSGVGNSGSVQADDHGLHGQPCSLRLSLPPLGAVVFASEAQVPAP